MRGIVIKIIARFPIVHPDPTPGVDTRTADSRSGGGESPITLCNAFEPDGNKHEGGVSVGECPYRAGEPMNLAVELLDDVVHEYTPPVFARESRVRQSLATAAPGVFDTVWMLGDDSFA